MTACAAGHAPPRPDGQVPDPPVGVAAGPGVGDPDVWRAFGQAVLTFHHRVWQTAMCQCGHTVVECDVLAQARAHGLLPPLPA